MKAYGVENMGVPKIFGTNAGISSNAAQGGGYGGGGGANAGGFASGSSYGQYQVIKFLKFL
jgi:hypothetical protein